MTDKSDALRLADGLQRDMWIVYGPQWCYDAAAELRRLHEEVQEQCRIVGMGAERELKLMAELEQARRDKAELVEALEGVTYWDNGKSEWETARAAIAKHGSNT